MDSLARALARLAPRLRAYERENARMRPASFVVALSGRCAGAVSIAAFVAGSTRRVTRAPTFQMSEKAMNYEKDVAPSVSELVPAVLSVIPNEWTSVALDVERVAHEDATVS